MILHDVQQYIKGWGWVAFFVVLPLVLRLVAVAGSLRPCGLLYTRRKGVGYEHGAKCRRSIISCLAV